MHKFEAEGLIVTENFVEVHGVWQMGATKRYQAVRVPLALFTADSVFQALCHAHSASQGRPDPNDDWQMFLEYG